MADQNSDYKELLKVHKKKPIIDFTSQTLVKVNFGYEDIIKIIPNRKPFFFIDSIKGIDLENKVIFGEKKILGDEWVFNGHFPGNPVYPGVIQLEMISEVFCSHYYFFSNNIYNILDNKQVNLRGVRMADALLQHGLFPDDEVVIATKILSFDDYFFSGLGQILKDNVVCVVVIGEYYIVQ